MMTVATSYHVTWEKLPDDYVLPDGLSWFNVSVSVLSAWRNSFEPQALSQMYR